MAAPHTYPLEALLSRRSDDVRRAEEAVARANAVRCGKERALSAAIEDVRRHDAAVLAVGERERSALESGVLRALDLTRFDAYVRAADVEHGRLAARASEATRSVADADAALTERVRELATTKERERLALEHRASWEKDRARRAEARAEDDAEDAHRSERSAPGGRRR
ncbi:MAG: hypothetical protein U0169_11925 [Polyangiaceae bacterium]